MRRRRQIRGSPKLWRRRTVARISSSASQSGLFGRFLSHQLLCASRKALLGVFRAKWAAPLLRLRVGIWQGVFAWAAALSLHRLERLRVEFLRRSHRLRRLHRPRRRKRLSRLDSCHQGRSLKGTLPLMISVSNFWIMRETPITVGLRRDHASVGLRRGRDCWCGVRVVEEEDADAL